MAHNGYLGTYSSGWRVHRLTLRSRLAVGCANIAHIDFIALAEIWDQKRSHSAYLWWRVTGTLCDDK